MSAPNPGKMAETQRLMLFRRSAASLTAATCMLVAAGCHEGPARPAGTTSVVPTYNAASGKLERITYDRDKDGRPDAWLFMDGTRPVRAELDENADGAVDRWEHYRGGAPAAPGAGLPRGELAKAEQDLRFDGKVSRWETYEQGRLVRVEEDTSGDGRPDKWETWADGSLVEVALDTTDRGTPDRRIVYPGEGGAPRMLVDTRGDGTFTPVVEP